jgi:L-lactate dehydrogenase (cytochrome)
MERFAIRERLVTTVDALRAAESDGTGVMISNHGGRQLDGAPAQLDQISAVVDAVGRRLEIICNGGIRRGGDIVRAIALGVRACSIGRPYLYRLSAGGEAGVAQALHILCAEHQLTMTLLGVQLVALIGRTHIRPVSAISQA